MPPRREERLPQETEPHRSSLKGLVIGGVGWMAASQVAIQVLALVTSIVMARFLGPREVGLAVQALVFGSLALVLVDFGIGSAVIQRPNLSEDDKSTAFWAGVGLGVTLMITGIGLSWPIAELYGEPQVQELFAVLSIGFLFTALGIVQGALLTREMRFRSLELRTITANAAASTVGIVLAISGFDAWAIVVQHLVITGASTALLWRASPWRPRAVFSVKSLRGMASYASNVLGTKMLGWGTSNVDNLLIGRSLGPSALGAYSIAFSVMLIPVSRIANPLLQVFFPAFSQMRDPTRIGAAWLRGVRMVALVVVPAMLGLIAVAPEFVEVAFGETWNDAVPVIQILAPVGILQALVALNHGVLQAVDRTRTQFRFTVVLSALLVAGFVAGLPWGITGVATAYLVVTVLCQPIFIRLTSHAIGLRFRDWAHTVTPVLQAGIVMLLVLLAVRELLVSVDTAASLRLVALVAMGVLIYVPLAAWRAPEARAEVRDLLRRRQRVPVAPDPVGQ
jgi:O-antigen/teichoic acid export membrane protein